jgi:hypothetical protein
MIDPADREHRRRRHERIDADSRHQSIGYAYLTSERGLRLERITPGREYDDRHGAMAAAVGAG